MARVGPRPARQYVRGDFTIERKTKAKGSENTERIKGACAYSASRGELYASILVCATTI